MSKTNSSKVLRMTILAVLIALELLMAFTPIGYLRLGALSISFLCIPIAIGAIVLGPTAGLTLGIVFGLTSFAQCFGMDPFGTAMMSINPFFTFVICVVSRALMGWLTGVIAVSLSKVLKDKKAGKFYLNDIIAVIMCPVMNTAFFLGFLALFFWNIKVMNLDIIPMVVLPALSINCVIEIAACAVVGSAVSIAVKKIAKI
ncbi:MAG: ECF transporter S component [Ruminococcus sp.]|nr:ECF transporter S component [Ruminococcus sp.]